MGRDLVRMTYDEMAFGSFKHSKLGQGLYRYAWTFRFYASANITPIPAPSPNHARCMALVINTAPKYAQDSSSVGLLDYPKSREKPGDSTSECRATWNLFGGDIDITRGYHSPAASVQQETQ